MLNINQEKVEQLKIKIAETKVIVREYYKDPRFTNAQIQPEVARIEEIEKALLKLLQDDSYSTIDELNRDGDSEYKNEEGIIKEDYFVDAETIVSAVAYKGTQKNRTEFKLKEFKLDKPDYRIKLEPESYGSFKIKVDSSAKLRYQTVGQAVVNITTLKETVIRITDFTVNYSVNKMGEVIIEKDITFFERNHQKGEDCTIEFKTIRNPSNQGQIVIQGNIKGSNGYNINENIYFTIEGWASPIAKVDPPETLNFEEELVINKFKGTHTIHFPLNKSLATEEEKTKIINWLIGLRKNEDYTEAFRLGKVAIEIIGYASPPGSKEKNLELGNDRANETWALIQNLVGKTINGAKIRTSISSFGEYDSSQAETKAVVVIIITD
jgi:outer membrane protein OmpA-like peptidoglycan-associated protein